MNPRTSAGNRFAPVGRSNPTGKLFANLVAVVISLALGVIGLEAALRLYFYGNFAQPAYGIDFFEHHPMRGWANKPDAKGIHQELDFRVPVTVNSRGLRGPEFSPQPDGRRQRILIVADSAMFGSGVRDEESVPAVLQKLLGPSVEVLNFSVNAYSTVQEYLWLREEGLGWKPDLVLLSFSPGNDVQTNVLQLQRLFQRTLRRPYASLDPDGALTFDLSAAQVGERRAPSGGVSGLLDNLVLRRVGRFILRKFMPGEPVDPNIFLGWPYLVDFVTAHAPNGRSRTDYEQLWTNGWLTTSALIAAMADESKAAGARFAMFVSTSKFQGDPAHRERIERAFPGVRIDPRKMDRELKALGDRLGVPTLDVTSAILGEAARGGPPLYFNFEDEHWTPRGNRIAAEALATQLRQSGLLKR